ncbi:MAG: zf-TFIIB domain-containing protein [Anaerolineales bacterium]|nr:zf-TFIIB domain-containing protein [Anaerolineales bacterium]
MNCPKCNSELMKKHYKGMIEIESCPNCRGMWLDFHELDQLEDVAFNEDSYKGSLVHYQTKTNYLCPHCNTKLDEFQYRLYDLKLDACMDNDHGFWLDAGEDERVIEIMIQRSSDIKRKLSVEMEWKHILKNMHSFLDKK